MYSQNDPKWKYQTLGTNTSGSEFTIGNYGCLVTSLVNACLTLGVTTINNQELNPSTLDEVLTKNNGFANGGDYVWGSLDNVIGQNIKESEWVFRWQYKFNENAELIKSKIESGNYACIIEIDYNPNTNAQDQHWVLIESIELIDKNNNNVTIIDSWDGQRKPLNQYFGATVNSSNDTIWCAKLITRKQQFNQLTPEINQPNQDDMFKEKLIESIKTKFKGIDAQRLIDGANNNDPDYIIAWAGSERLLEVEKLTKEKSEISKQLIDTSSDYAKSLSDKKEAQDAQTTAEEKTRGKEATIRQLEIKLEQAKADLTTEKATVEAQKETITRQAQELDGKQKVILTQADTITAKPKQKTLWDTVEFIKGRARIGELGFISSLGIMVLGIATSPQFFDLIKDTSYAPLAVVVLPYLAGLAKTLSENKK